MSFDLSPEEKRQRGRRNLAIAGLIFLFMAVVYLVTLLRIGGAASGGA